MNIAVNGIDLHWEESGEGEPLLWLHGALGCGGDWRHIFQTPPAGFRVIAPDLRGHGASTDPGGAFTFRTCARDVLALMAHLGLSRVKAIGLSGGGIVALHMATLEPSSLASMVVVSAPPYFPEQARLVQRRYSEAALDEAERAGLVARHPRGEGQLRALLAMVHRMAETYDDVNFTPPYLGTITAETLVVFGDADPLYPVDLAFELRRAIPHAFLWVVPNGGHGPVFGSHAAEFSRTALAFLRGEWGRSPSL